MKKKLTLLCAALTALLLSGCRITVNGSSSPFMLGFMGVLITAVGLWNYCDPESAFHFSEGWKYDNMEPSEAGLDSRRWGGLLMMAVGLVLLFNSCSA